MNRRRERRYRRRKRKRKITQTKRGSRWNRFFRNFETKLPQWLREAAWREVKPPSLPGATLAADNR